MLSIRKLFFLFFFSFFIFSQAKFMEEKPISDFEKIMKILNETNLQKIKQLKFKIYDQIIEASNDKFPFKDKKGWTLFNYIVISNNQKLIKYFLEITSNLGKKELLKYLQSKDFGGNTPLHSAAKFGKINAVKILLFYGANSVAINNEGQTPGDLAICSDISELLLNDLHTNWISDQQCKKYSQIFTFKKPNIKKKPKKKQPQRSYSLLKEDF